MKMRHSLLLICFCFISACKSSVVNGDGNRSLNNSYAWEENDKMCALRRDGKIIWKLNFDDAQDKPYFHPLRTPKGHDLTLERPDDHPWHRGLWFSWKDINGVNYWEEDPSTGVAKGRSIINAVHVETNQDFSAKIVIDISYEENKIVLLKEVRTLIVSAPSAKDDYTIHWHQSFDVQNDIRLYLEKPEKHGGKSWGGYAGLSYRVAASLSDHRFLSSNGWENTNSLTGYGEKGKWMDLTAKVTGTAQEYAGLTILDSPQNPRYPSPWYIWFTVGEHAFFTPSMLFDGPMNFSKGDGFTLQYLIFVHDGKRTTKQLNQIAKTLD
jgi:hypothetical protein